MGWLQTALAWLRGRPSASATGGPATATSNARGRVSGEPASSNGASSFHLFWQLPGEFVSVSATLEVVDPPSVDRLYFWALQAGFTGPGGAAGAGHLGLQAHPQHPGGTAVNWGGYDERGRVLGGSASALPSALDNANTRDYPWQAGRRYRLTIQAVPADAALDPSLDPSLTAWRGSVTDLSSGETTAVRDLFARGSRLASPMVWSEVFARCEQPAVEVHWSAFEARTDDGQVLAPPSVTVNYQADRDGGCANTNSWVDAGELIQRTCCARSTPQSARLTLAGGAAGGTTV
jgi:hypothetical protein